MFQIFIFLSLAVICRAEDFNPIDKLPNPYGFDNRILLVNHLQEVYQISTAGMKFENIQSIYHDILRGDHIVGPRGVDIEISKEFILRSAKIVAPIKKESSTKNGFNQNDMNILQLQREFKVFLPKDADEVEVAKLLQELIERRKSQNGVIDITPPTQVGVPPARPQNVAPIISVEGDIPKAEIKFTPDDDWLYQRSVKTDVDVPVEWQVEVRNPIYLGYGKVSGSPDSWVKSDGSNDWPNAVTRITAREVQIERKFYKILSYGILFKDLCAVGIVVNYTGGSIKAIPKPWRERGYIMAFQSGRVISSDGDVVELRDNTDKIRWLWKKKE